MQHLPANVTIWLCAEHKGRTIHLLKAGSKPVPQDRKRRKVSLAGTFAEYQQEVEERKQEEAKMEEVVVPAQEGPCDKGGGGFGPPNIIGNVEDQHAMGDPDPSMGVNSNLSGGQQPAAQMEASVGGFTDITPELKRQPRAGRSKARGGQPP